MVVVDQNQIILVLRRGWSRRGEKNVFPVF